MQSYRGLSGRMKVFGQQFLNAMGWHRTPAPGTALWEAKQEIEKLSRILISRANAIEQGRFDANKAGEIATELEMIQAQLAFYEGIANSVTKDSKGKGYVAMADLNHRKFDLVFDFFLNANDAHINTFGNFVRTYKQWERDRGTEAIEIVSPPELKPFYDQLQGLKLQHLNENQKDALEAQKTPNSWVKQLLTPSTQNNQSNLKKNKQKGQAKVVSEVVLEVPKHKDAPNQVVTPPETFVMDEMNKLLGTKMKWVKSGEISSKKDVFSNLNYKKLGEIAQLTELDIETATIGEIYKKFETDYNKVTQILSERAGYQKQGYIPKGKEITEAEILLISKLASLDFLVKELKMDKYKMFHEFVYAYSTLTISQAKEVQAKYAKFPAVSLMKNEKRDQVLSTIGNSDPTVSDFALWANASSKSNADKYFGERLFQGTPRMSCWEAVLLGAYNSKLLDWETLNKIYTLNERTFFLDMAKVLKINLKRILKDGNPKKGDIVFFKGTNHVAISTGITKFIDGKLQHEVITFWPAQDYSKIEQGALLKVRIDYIERIVNFMGSEASLEDVTFGKPTDW